MATEPDPTPTPTPTPPAGDPTPSAGRSFTQEEVDRIIADRLARAKSAPPADYEDLKKAAGELDALKAAQLTETEKLQKRAEAAEAKAAEAAQRASNALKRAAVVAAAQRAGAVDPDAVFALLDQSAVTVGDDGQVTGVDEAVKALLETKQYLVGKAPTPTPGAADGGVRGAGPSSITKESLRQMSPQQVAQLMATNPAEVNAALAN